MAPLIPLEDSWSDVIGKARRGLKLTEEELAAQSGVAASVITSLETGILNLSALAKISEFLGLHQGKLLALAHEEYHPGALTLPRQQAAGIMMFTAPWNEMEVHSYLLWDTKLSTAAAFDTGPDAWEMLDFLQKHFLKLEQIFLTHAHGDHVFELDRLVEKTGASAWIGEREELPGAENFTAGTGFRLGALDIETRSTWGHSIGGISYIIHGLDLPIAIVGDALFAGSIGGAMISYQASLETNRRELFSLPQETLLLPGHGPITTVEFEKKHNPFFV